MRDRPRLLTLGLVVLVLAGTVRDVRTQSTAQPAINPALLTNRWEAQWITHAGARGAGVFLFRRTFDLPAKPDRFVVHTSADQRYELFVNGERAALGPARGDLNHWRFETTDLAPWLRQGPNVIAAIVWNFGEHAPMAQVSHRTGFVLQGDGKEEAIANSGKGWKTQEVNAWTLLPVDRAAIFHQYFVSGPGEQIDGARYPWGWERPGFEDGSWQEATIVGIAAPRAIRDSPSRWFLVPRGIPPMEDREDRFTRIARSAGNAPPPELLRGKTAWTVPARSTAVILLDRGELTTAYPEIATSRGRGASIEATYAEALYTPRADGRRGEKGNRDEVEGKIIRGLQDRFLPDGGDTRVFRPLWWRTYRYVQLAIRTADEPLIVHDVRGRFSAYPLKLAADFTSSDPELRRIFDIGWRTVRLCAHETYMDTPYWEQLQYIGDTRIQALVTLYLAGNPTFVKHAIELFDHSHITDGLTQSRYPTDLPQIIPPFSLFWVGMLHDLWWYTGEIDDVRGYLRGARGVLAWFEDRLLPNGLLGPLEWWNFADWIDGWPHGEPPFHEGGQSTILTLQFVLALREAADLEESAGEKAAAEHHRALADRLVSAVKQAAWSEERQLFADTPARASFSQHANVLAILADALPAAEQPALMRRVLEDASLTQATYYFKFYLFRALRKAGLADRYLEQLQPWKTMIDLGLTTWAERPEPTRSDSHAWSAHPSVDLLTTVAGIQPAQPGFKEVLIAPHLGTLTQLSVRIPTPRGEVAVEYHPREGTIDARVTLPPGTTGTLRWAGREAKLIAGEQTVTLGP